LGYHLKLFAAFRVVPIGPVQNVMFIRNNRSVTVNFDPPTVVTGVFAYYVEYYVTVDGPASALNRTLPQTSSTFDPLLPFTNYTFTVSTSTYISFNLLL